VLRNTGDGLELRVSRHVTTSNSMPLALALCRASKSRAERSTSRAVGAYLHQQSMPWVSFVRFLVRGRLDGSPSVSYGAVLEV
jgi:hypothetical protein